MNKILSIIFLVVLAWGFLGCNTVKYTAQGITKGVAADFSSGNNVIKKADDWFQENYW